jgi:hypothetical protein
LKKSILILFAALAFAAPAFADLWAIRSFVDILGEGNMVLNASDILSVNAEGAQSGVSYNPALAFNGVFMFGGNDGIFALYLKKDFIDVRNNTTALLSSKPPGSAVSVNEQWGMHYLGIGGRKYFFVDNFSQQQLLPYLALDLGAFFSAFTDSKINVFDAFGHWVASGERDADGIIFGVNVEAGVDYWFMNEFAVTLKTGYRFCNGTVRSVITTDDPTTPLHTLGIPDVLDSKIDYSGFFLQVGISFNFARYD